MAGGGREQSGVGNSAGEARALSLSATSETDFFCSFLPFHHPSSSRLQWALARKHWRPLGSLYKLLGGLSHALPAAKSPYALFP
jgi:hypothetical protein